MANSFISLIDSDETLTESTVLGGIANVPFVRHQYKWLLGEIRKLPLDGGASLVAGYCGIKKLSQSRRGRIEEACRVVSSIPDLEFAKLPESISDSLSKSKGGGIVQSSCTRSLGRVEVTGGVKDKTRARSDRNLDGARQQRPEIRA